MRNAKARIKDIAERAQVSAGTVDRVIHNRGRVAPDVQKRVLRILAEMNYEPNLIARALGSNKEYRIAALIPDPEFDPYWLAPKEGIEKAAAGVRQYGVTIQQYAFNPYVMGSFIHRAKQVSHSNPDAILLSPVFNRETQPFFEEWKAQNIPFVLFNSQISGSGALSYVGQDSYQSGILAGKLAHYGLPERSSILLAHIDEEISNSAHLLKKEQGFKDYFKQNDLEDHYHIIHTELTRSDLPAFNDTLDTLLDKKSDVRSIYVTSSKAYKIANYFEQRGIRRINLIGYDLLPHNVYYLSKGHISFLINQNPKGQGYWGIQQLVNHLVFKKPVPEIKHLPLDIVTKENVAYYTREEMIYDYYNMIV